MNKKFIPGGFKKTPPKKVAKKVAAKKAVVKKAPAKKATKKPPGHVKDPKKVNPVRRPDDKRIGNTFAADSGVKVGAPRFFETPEDLQAAVDEYFEYIKGKMTKITLKKIVTKGKGKDKEEELCDVEEMVWERRPEPATITGLVLFLGFVSRQSLTDYQHSKDGKFSDIIRWARLRVEYEYEKSLHADGHSGIQFALTNMGWKNKSEVHNTGEGAPSAGVVKIDLNVYQTGPELASTEEQLDMDNPNIEK